MPPFQAEANETLGKPLPFLSRAVKKEPKPHPVRAFAAEPAESDHGAKAQRRLGSSCLGSTLSVFQAEGEEPDSGKRPRLSQRQVGGSSSSRPTQVFGPEPDESDSSLFNLPSSDDDMGSEQDYVPKSDSVFALGWHSLSSLKDATFWKDNMDDPMKQKPKRKYDNTKRQASAQYARLESQDTYKKNGLDPGRLQKLLNLQQCQCPLHLRW